jgi:hypothetical protein
LIESEKKNQILVRTTMHDLPVFVPGEKDNWKRVEERIHGPG